MGSDGEADGLERPQYDDEILDANWIPRPEAPLRVVRSAAQDERRPPLGSEDAEAFLAAMYRNQQ